MAPNHYGDLLTSNEAADFLGLSYSRVNQLLQQGRIPFTWIGPMRMIRKEDLVRFQKEPRVSGRHTGRRSGPR